MQRELFAFCYQVTTVYKCFCKLYISGVAEIVTLLYGSWKCFNVKRNFRKDFDPKNNSVYFSEFAGYFN